MRSTCDRKKVEVKNYIVKQVTIYIRVCQKSIIPERKNVEGNEQKKNKIKLLKTITGRYLSGKRAIVVI